MTKAGGAIQSKLNRAQEVDEFQESSQKLIKARKDLQESIRIKSLERDAFIKLLDDRI